jgi:hypothetical protein
MYKSSRTFTSKLIRQPDGAEIGTFESSMDLVIDGDTGHIEWDIPHIEVTHLIGLWFEHGVLVDYDGVHCLPGPAIEMIKEAGAIVGEEFA